MPLTKRQVDGVVALVVITALICVSNLLISRFPSSPVNRPVPFSKKTAGTDAVALAVDGTDRGIFFLPRGATVSDLLTAADIKLPQKLSVGIRPRGLSAGDKVFLTPGSTPIVKVGKMSSAQLLALDLPLSINHAAFDDLVLIPGIGEKTAAAIIALREKKGDFHKVEELMEIKGIKEKKLAELKRYLYAGRD